MILEQEDSSSKKIVLSYNYDLATSRWVYFLWTVLILAVIAGLAYFGYRFVQMKKIIKFHQEDTVGDLMKKKE